MQKSDLTTIVEDRIWSLERPVWFSGIRQRARTTVLRLDDGSLLLHSPAPPSEQLAEQLLRLGPVRWLVVPNCFHHLGAPAAAARFPDAQVVGPASALRRSSTLRIDVDIRDYNFWAQLPEIEPLPLLGVPFLDETALYHRPTRTLLAADLVLCASAADHWSARCIGRMFGFYDRVRVPPDVKHKIPDKAAASRSIRAMLARPVERLVVGHADVLGDGCMARLAEAWKLEGVEL